MIEGGDGFVAGSCGYRSVWSTGGWADTLPGRATNGSMSERVGTR